MPRKKVENSDFNRGPLHRANISQIFLWAILSENICSQFWELYSTGPQNFIHILPAACLNWNWFHCKSFFCSWLCSTRPKIYIKSETGQGTISKYFDWDNWIWRKWKMRKTILFWKIYKKNSHIVHWKALAILAMFRITFRVQDQVLYFPSFSRLLFYWLRAP